MMITLAVRVLEGWFVLGVALGLCWTAACFTARRARDALVGIRKLELARRLLDTLFLPPPGHQNAAQGELFSFGLGLALPTHAAPASVALTRLRVRSQA